MTAGPQIKKRSRSERGSVTVVTAALLLLLAVLALVMADLVRALTSKSRAQIAADAAALAAAQELVVNAGGNAARVAAAYARENGALLESCDCATGSQAVVTVRVPFRTWFFGRSLSVSATARAVAESPAASP